jgi:hypothetical protein
MDFYLLQASQNPIVFCSFLVDGRNYSFKRMPFGLNISGPEFQKSMDRVLGSLLHTFVTIYVDDILITSQDEESHYRHIHTVVTKFKLFNITVNIDKCKFFLTLNWYPYLYSRNWYCRVKNDPKIELLISYSFVFFFFFSLYSMKLNEYF